MTQAQMVRNIQQRLSKENGVKVSKEIIKQVMDIEADEIYMIVASNDSYKYLWGTISGISKPPTKISGKFRELKGVIDNYGYSQWKDGYPHIKWSKIMKVYEIKPPEEYFELPNVRYTTAARDFRIDAELPEIPEYEGLSEEKIEEFCKRADKVSLEKTGYTNSNQKQRSIEYGKMVKTAVQEYWTKIGYVPMGVIDKNWKGPQRDSIDGYLKKYLHEEDSPVDKLEVVLSAIDLAEWLKEYKKHPELDEMVERFNKEIEEQGLQPMEHIKKEYVDNRFGLRYKGQEDPWGIMNISRLTLLRHKRIAQQEQELLDDIENAKNYQEGIDINEDDIDEYDELDNEEQDDFEEDEEVEEEKE